MRNLSSFLVSAALLSACQQSEAPLADLDKRYGEVMRDLAAADRDTARNVRNNEARGRKVDAERARVAFFKNPKVMKQVEEARKAEDAALKALGEAWWREALTARSWTEDEKAEETRLLGKLEEARSMQASWTSPDGAVQIPLDEDWVEVSRKADALSEADRVALAQEYVDHQMGILGESLQELIRLRNEVARREGFSTYWELALAAQGLSPAEVEDLVEQLSLAVRPVNAELHQRLQEEALTLGITDSWASEPLLRRRAGLEAGRDEADHWFDTDLAEERVTRAFQDMGIETAGWQVFSGPRRYVRPGVYGFPIDPPSEVAIVMSQDSRWSVWQYEALAHEGGHAAWWNALSPEQALSPMLWQPPSPWFEGFAQFFERQVYDPAFTARYVPELPAEQREALAAWRARQLAGWISESIVKTLVEKRLYEDPTNLEAVARYAAQVRSQLTGRPSAPAAHSGIGYDDALLSPIVWNYPAYSQNFLFAYVTEAALDEAVTQRVGAPVGNAAVGPLLVSELVHAPVTAGFRERLVGLLGSEDLVAPLKADLQGPPPKEAPAAVAAEGG